MLAAARLLRRHVGDTVPSVVPSVVTRSSTPRVLASGAATVRSLTVFDTASLARPKSSTFASPRRVTKIFAGLMSRCTMLAGVRAPRARRRFRARARGRARTASGPPRSRSFSVWPSSSSITMKLLAVVLADVVDRADVRMVQRRGDARLAPEAFERLGVRGQLARQELERDLTAERGRLPRGRRRPCRRRRCVREPGNDRQWCRSPLLRRHAL